MSTKKTLYHSELVRMGIVTALVKNEPQDSQYPGKPRWVPVEIDGVERYLNLENTGCELAISGCEGQWVTLEARGQREEATLTVEPTERPASAKPQHPEPKAADKKQTADEKEQPEMRPEATQESIEEIADYVGRTWIAAWNESKDSMAQIPSKDAEELTTFEWLDLRVRIAAGINIEINKILRKERF